VLASGLQLSLCAALDIKQLGWHADNGSSVFKSWLKLLLLFLVLLALMSSQPFQWRVLSPMEDFQQ
jgi:hypothetical protein